MNLFPNTEVLVEFNQTLIKTLSGNKISYRIGVESGVIEKCLSSEYCGYTFKSINGKKYFLSTKKKKYPLNFDAAFFIDADQLTDKSIETIAKCQKSILYIKIPTENEIVNSWAGAFSYQKEVQSFTGEVITYGLRPPQIGALHSIQAHWCISKKTAIVVMPTGTGKTETMLSLTIAEQCNGLLILVPSDSLRSQIAEKFITLGILKHPRFKIVSYKGLNPIVCTLNSGIKDFEHAKSIFRSNVIVSTPQLIQGILKGEDKARNAFFQWCRYLFVDEAHHSQASTWKNIKQHLEIEGKKVLLFTATPFRNDKKRLLGDIIYNYPLSLAQRDNYYKKIDFFPILEFNNQLADEKIALKAIELLIEDRKNGFDHLLMVRVDKKDEAERIFKDIYSKYKDFSPIYIHSGIKAAEKKDILERIKNGFHKIIICVDMLGEGFDLPQLKICALHDLHKNITTSFQFFGRFTRESDLKLGNAKFVANIIDTKLKGTLRKLYQKDSDWDSIIRHANEKVIQGVIDEEDFFKNFSDVEIPNKIPLRNITPAMSTVVFKLFDSGIKWNPENHSKYFNEYSYETVTVEHNERNLLVIIAKKTSPVDWGKIEDLVNCDYELYIIYLNPEKKLLFINSSNNGSTHNKLADAVCGNNKALFCEANIYRCLDGIFQLELFNLGLKSVLNEPISFTMYAGNGIVSGLDELDNNKTSSNLFGVGYENGEKVSIGCSSKGRIWTKLIKTIPDFCDWCNAMGDKLLDDSISTENIFKFIQKPERIKLLPAEKHPISIKWDDEFYRFPTKFLYRDFPFADYSIEFVDKSQNSITFSVNIEGISPIYQLILLDDENSRGFEYKQIGGYPLKVKHAREEKDLIDLFFEFPPIIWFHDNSKMHNNIFFPFKGSISIFDINKIVPFNWEGVDIRKESQKKEKRIDSIQYNILQRLKSDSEYDIIFDDDDANEASDIIAIKTFDHQERRVQFELYHCKYSSKSQSGGRLKDLYDVCGQAQRSFHWKHYTLELINHMIRREESRVSQGNNSRFERGGSNEMLTVKNMLSSGLCKPEFNIFIVQPGISKAEIINETEHLKLLGATDLLLKKTGNNFYVISDK
jgi:superfamily II DNA or RNA helicase